jgi:hypothetical protein
MAGLLLLQTDDISLRSPGLSCMGRPCGHLGSWHAQMAALSRLFHCNFVCDDFRDHRLRQQHAGRYDNAGLFSERFACDGLPDGWRDRTAGERDSECDAWLRRTGDGRDEWAADRVSAKPATLMLVPGVAQSITFTADTTVAGGSATVTLTGTSGELSHTAAVALTTAAPPPPPDFSLTVIPTSQTLVAETTGTALSLQATATGGFASQIAVGISGLPAGVSANPALLTLTPGTAQNVTLTASTGAAIGTSTVTFTGTAG